MRFDAFCCRNLRQQLLSLQVPKAFQMGCLRLCCGVGVAEWLLATAFDKKSVDLRTSKYFGKDCVQIDC